MKTIYLILIILIISGFANAQNRPNKDLRVGGYFTEAEGAEKLVELRKEYQTKEEWLARAEIIKQGILKGAELVPFPKKK